MSNTTELEKTFPQRRRISFISLWWCLLWHLSSLQRINTTTGSPARVCIYNMTICPSRPPRPPAAAARVYLSPRKTPLRLRSCSWRGHRGIFLNLCPVWAASWWREVDLCLCHRICEINITRYQKPQIWPLSSDPSGKSDLKWGLKSLCMFAESLLMSDMPVSLERTLQGQNIYLSQLPALWTFPFWATKHSVPGGQNYNETVTHHQSPDWSRSHGASGSFSSERWRVI